jgi:VWFA-related protein
MRPATMAIPLVVLAVGTLAAPQEPQQAPIFPARAERVLLDLVVRDKSGRSVDDLRSDEVQVLEDGKPCAVASFRLVRADVQEKGPGPAASTPAPAAPTAPPTQPPGEGLTTVVGLVFDQLGADAAKNARAAALQMAQRSFPKGSVFAVFKVGQGLSVLQSFTESRASLPRAIERATSGADQARDPARTRGYDSATEEAFEKARKALAAASGGSRGVSAAEAGFLQMEAQMLLLSDQVAREGQGQASLQPLLAIVRGLEAVQGRKSLLYFSEGLAVPPSVESVFQAAVSAANRANVSVYTFDARGLRVRSPFEETQSALDLAREATYAAQKGEPTLGIDGGDVAQDALRLNRQGVLRDLAESTGGFLVAETNDLRPGLDRVITDLRSYYEVGYTPPNAKADGRWRSISVKVSRPGVVVRTRRGYYALPPGSPAVLPYELALGEALAATPMPRDVEHRAATLRFAGAEAKTETLVWVEVPLAGLTLWRGETTYRGHLSLLGLVKDDKGALVARLSHDLRIEGPLAEIDAARQRTNVVKRSLRLAPGRYVLETAVQDRESGRLGARRAAFEVPAPRPSLQLGSLAIVRADEASAAETSADDPLRAGTLRATPLLGRSFPEGTSAVSLLLSLYAGPSAAAPELDLEFRRDGQAVSHAKPQLPAPDASGRITYLGSLPAAELPPGRYEVWARARLGEEEATDATAFTITPRAPAAVVAAPPAAKPAAGPTPGSLEDRKGVATPLATILERAARYVLEYESTFRDLVAEEAYRQWGPNLKAGFGQVARTLRSDLVFVRLPGPLPWGTFRDVYEVDGQKVRDRQRRLEKLFFSPKASDYERAQAILNESSRYNLGQPYRNVNVPNLGLLFLRPENQERLAFKRKGSRAIAGFPTAEVAFEERTSPTLVHDRWGNDVPASGRFWIDETRGTVLRTEIEYDLETDKATRSPDAWEKGLVSTEYRREVALGCFVPDTMTELYNFWGLGRIDAVARYSNYRRFEVSVGTAELLPLTYGADTAGEGTAGAVPPKAESAAEPVAPLEPTGVARPEPRPLDMRPVPELPGSPGSLLQKAGEYVLRYERAFRNVAAEERYQQKSSIELAPRFVARLGVPRQQGFANDERGALAAEERARTDAARPQPGPAATSLRSEVVFALLPGPAPFTLLRDVLEKDGRVLREAGRLEPLFRASPSGGLREAAEVTLESERLILGPTDRTINVPTFALAFLEPGNRDSFAFKRRGAGRVRGEAAVEIAFEEVARPTLMQDGAGRDLPLRGAFFLREADGAVLRSRTELAFLPSGSADAPSGRMTITTEYEADPSLGQLVPTEMLEGLDWRMSGPVLGQTGGLEGRARYSGFHRIGAVP